MRLNFKKISAIASSAVMAVSSIALAAAANYPAPFVAGGVADVAIVYGTGAGVSVLDTVQAGNIQTNLQASLGSATTTSTTSVSGGDSVNLGTSSRKIYYGDAISVGKASIGSVEMPSVLQDKKFIDLAGTEYSYTQTLKTGPAAITFGTSGGDLNDPTLYIDGGNNGALTSGHLYNYTLSLSKNLNVSDSTNVQGQKINILGVDYVIGASSTNTTLYLYGSGETITVIGGEESTVKIGETDHTVTLVTTSSATAGTLKVDGVQKSVTEGSSYAFAGNINVYVKDIIHPAYAGDIRQAELIMGSNTLLIQNGQSVKQGADQTTIKSTLGTVTAAGNGLISGFSVAIGMPKTQTDAILAGGDSFVDPVFGGLKLQLATITPNIDSTTRGKILLNTDNNQYAYITLTTARAGSIGEQKLTYVYDNNTASTAVQPLLAHQTISTNNRGLIHVLEGEDALQNDWIIVNQGDAGTILSVEDISIDTATSGSVTLGDVVTGESQKITLTNSSGVYAKTNHNFFGGNGYTINVNNAGTTVNVTWSSSGVKTLFPRIKLKDGGWISFLSETTIPYNVWNGSTNILFPDGQTNIATTGTALLNTTLSYHVNGITWGARAAIPNVTIIQNITGGGALCNFNASQGPAILYIEPKKWNDGSYGDYICVPLTTTGTTEIAIGTPVLNGTDSGFATYGSDTYKSAAIDTFGTFVTLESRTNENGVVNILNPTSQMYADVLFSAVGATVSSTDGTSTPATSLGEVLVTDSEVSSVSTKNLIIVGGSCINSAAAKVLGLTGGACGAAFTDKTGIGSGEFLIESVGDAYTTGKIALVVAGYDAADTVNAAKYLTTKTVDTTAGKKYKGTSATTATLVTTTA